MRQIAYILGYRNKWLTRRERGELMVVLVFACVGCALAVASILYMNGLIAPEFNYNGLLQLPGNI